MSSALSANGFYILLSKLLDIGSQQVYINTGLGTCTVFVNFANRALFAVTGFNPDPCIQVDKVQVTQTSSDLDQKLRKKTGNPWEIASYLADHINALAGSIK